MSLLRMLALPTHIRVELTWRLASDKDLRLVRAELLRHFATAHGQGATAEAVGLVMTELAGNALRHGKPPVLIRLLGDDDCHVLDVVDHATDRVPRQPPPQRSIQAGGRGLRIALAVAQEVSWHVDGDAKHVWATFPRSVADRDVVPPC